MRHLLLALLLSLLVSAGYAQNLSTAPAPGLPISLDQAFKLTLAKSETLASSAEGIKQLEAAERQIKSYFLPSLNLNTSETLNAAQTGKFQSAVSLSYSIFDGMRDYIAAKAAGLVTGSARLEFARARQALYQDVALAYIDLVEIRQEISVRQEQLAVSNSRIKELQDREKIGRSRESEVVAAQAQLASDDADLQSARSRESLAQFELRFLTGLNEDIAPDHLRLPENQHIDPYLAGAARRFDVEAARKALEAARLDAEIAENLAWPSLYLDADYYLKRPSPNQDSHWAGVLTLKIPLYTGGSTDASIDQASAKQTAAEFALKLAIRQADTEVKQSYSTLIHSIAVLESLRKAIKLADENAKFQSRDYTLGLVTNLDVLNAQNTLLQTKLRLEQAHAQTCLAGIQLEVAGGGPAVNMEEK
ncbi:MAG: TolC family protein [Elusimicrobia bacterium]|nr:TolC family protein [Elusimicrobiota bacterium]